MHIFDVPYPIAVIASVIILDFLIWGQHLLFHNVPVLWRLHAVHHADRDLDVSSGGRFHPVEILLSMLIKFMAIACIGAPAVAVILFEIILNATAMFNHSNVALPGWLDKIVRRVIVTPDMHRIHHSVHPDETNSNYGFNLSIWDKLFGTYTQDPRDGQENMEIGLSQFQAEHQTIWLPGMLSLPFNFTPSASDSSESDVPGVERSSQDNANIENNKQDKE
ncbi:sterol desaturase family protein [Veronia nyctiphanis]|uniref:sterol desaturase family protein n=1 Tax=Veronia nyctiphanis TaxID=1278244 RepID=UPI002E26B2FC